MAINNGIRITALGLVLAAALAGCGEKDAESKAATQVAAKVNSDEITVHQINYEMSRLNGKISPDQAKAAANQVLNGLVDQHLLVQKAIDEKIDRDPVVLQNLEAARRQILAQAYLQRLTDKAISPTAAEIEDYYAKNPALFAERRIYRLQEISIPVTPENAESIKAQLTGLRSLQELGAWLKSVNIPARAVQSVKAAEELPFDLLSRLHPLKNGQTVNIATPRSLNIFYLADTQSQPLSLEQARPAIERYLINARKREISKAEIGKLRESAKLEFLGEYTDAGKVAAPAPQANATN